MNNPFKRKVNPVCPPVQSGDVAYRNINTACLIAIAAVCITITLSYTRTILIPLVISVFIYTMMTPVIRYLRLKMRIPHWVALIIVSALFAVPLVLVIIFFVNSAANFIQFAGTYQEKLLQAYNWAANFAREYNIQFFEEAADLQGLTALLSGEQVANLIKGAGSVTLKMLSYSTIVFIFLFFFLIGSGRSSVTNAVIKDAQNKISGYLFIKIIASLASGISVGIVYIAAGLEFAVMFAVFAVILNFIPNVGSILSVLLPLPIALIQYGFGPQFWIVLIIPGCLQFLIGNIIEPKFLGSGLDLHPAAVIGSLIFWALVWGIPGAFLAVPITSAIRVILSQLEPTRPFAEVLAGRLPK